MPSQPSFHSIGSRLPLIIIMVGALVATCFIGTAIGNGEYMQIYLLFFTVAALVAVFGMGSKYWMLIPFAFSFNLPAIPFRGRAFELPEIAAAVCGIIFVCRYAINTRGVTIFRWPHAGVILYALWAGIIFFLHPVGLMAAGSSNGGARFYFEIGLALISFLVVANQKIAERDAKWIIRAMIIGSLISMVVNIVQYKIAPPVITDPNAYTEEGYYTWHQTLSGPAMWIMLWLVSRYRVREIFGFANPWAFLLAVLCVAIAAISGKRAGLASVLITPLIAAILRKERVYVFTSALIATLLIVILTVGQGAWFRLPLQVQRSLSYLPGKWDWEVRSQFQGGIDPFRQELRDLAWNNIRAHPFVGQGYGVNARELLGLGRVTANFNEYGIMVMAFGSSWHNTWLGYWADFGLPAIIFWAFFWLQAVVIGYRVYRGTEHGTAFRTLGVMILLYFICDILRSWTSGHSADDPFTRWWMYGVLLSLASGLNSMKHQKGPPRLSRQRQFETVHSFRSLPESNPTIP